MTGHRIVRMAFGKVYPACVATAEKKGRPKAEVAEILPWYIGNSQEKLAAQIAAGVDFERFFAGAPATNPARALITGVVWGERVEAVDDPLMREIRYLDKLVDELATGKAMRKILREG